MASLIHKPGVLFLDEPTIGLDPVVKENIRGLIRQMNREYHTTILLTSHDVGDIEKLCRRIIIMNAGQIVLDDSMEHLKQHYLSGERREQERNGEIQVHGSHAGFHRHEDAESVDSSSMSLEDIIMEIYRAEGRTEVV